jgi:hypothetical protein
MLVVQCSRGLSASSRDRAPAFHQARWFGTRAELGGMHDKRGARAKTSCAFMPALAPKKEEEFQKKKNRKLKGKTYR